MCSIERSDVYLVNESSKLESVNRVHEIGEKSHSLLDHPRTASGSRLFGSVVRALDFYPESHQSLM